MKVLCPYCGKSVVVHGLGRKAFSIPVTKVCDALRLRHNVLAAAKELDCSRGYIYKVLKQHGMTPKEVLSK
jgi:transposase-like protein